MEELKYAGIGSRSTPKEIMDLMKLSAKFLANKNFVLRSGGADGADLAFEEGVNLVNGKKEIYLPWKGFNNSNSTLVVEEGEAYEIAERFHPYWHNLKSGARKLQARNSHQVLGYDLKSPSEFVLCYTPKGSRKGGTGQALRIADEYGIKIFDFGLYEDNLEKAKEEFRKFIFAYI